MGTQCSASKVHCPNTPNYLTEAKLVRERDGLVHIGRVVSEVLVSDGGGAVSSQHGNRNRAAVHELRHGVEGLGRGQVRAGGVPRSQQHERSGTEVRTGDVAKHVRGVLRTGFLQLAGAVNERLDGDQAVAGHENGAGPITRLFCVERVEYIGNAE